MQKSSTRWWDFPSVALLVIAVFTASVRLVITEWTADLREVETVVLFGAFLGLALGWSHFKKLGVTLLTIGYSLTFIPWRLTLLTDDQFMAVERINEVSQRLSLAFRLLTQKQPVDDHLFFVILMSVLFWIVGLYSGYALIRSQGILPALIPTTLLIVIIQYYDGAKQSHIWVTGIYFFFSLLLLGRLTYLQNRKRWKKRNVFLVPDVGVDLSAMTFTAITVVMLIAWSVPSSSAEWRDAAKWWRKTTRVFDKTRERFDDIFSAVDNNSAATSNVLYGSLLPLGERTYQGDQELFYIQPPQLDLNEAPPRFYWRMRTYDTYNNGSWSHSDSVSEQLFSAMSEISTPNMDARLIGDFTFTNKADTRSILVTGPQPIWIDIDTLAVYTTLPDDTLDVDMLRAQPALAKEATYIARSALISPSVANLRQAGTNYPNWVTERYLQLPDNFPATIRDLALNLTRSQGTPYDKARAITSYLRKEITYSSEIPAPPRGRDPLEWFLFEWQEGFCNYAASADVVMLRAAGVPARMAVGFAQGKRDASGNFTVLQRDAHAWPEVYFPNIGWVEFEPTLNQALLIRPAGEQVAGDGMDDMLSGRDDFEIDKELAIPLPEEDLTLPETVQAQNKTDSRQLIFWGIIVLITVAVGLGLWYLDRKQLFVPRALRFVVQVYERNNLSVPAWLNNWSKWSESPPITRAFNAINVGLRWLDKPAPTHFTPAERANALERLLPQAENDIAALLHEHQKALFSPHQGDAKLARRAGLSIRLNALRKKFAS